jgi:monoamine oxidase
MRRRDFLKRTAAAAAALSAHPVSTLASARERLERRGAAKRIVIVGAGLAGLSAAYELTQAGHDVSGHDV